MSRLIIRRPVRFKGLGPGWRSRRLSGWWRYSMRVKRPKKTRGAKP